MAADDDKKEDAAISLDPKKLGAVAMEQLRVAGEQLEAAREALAKVVSHSSEVSTAMRKAKLRVDKLCKHVRRLVYLFRCQASRSAVQLETFIELCNKMKFKEEHLDRVLELAEGFDAAVLKEIDDEVAALLMNASEMQASLENHRANLPGVSLKGKVATFGVGASLGAAVTGCIVGSECLGAAGTLAVCGTVIASTGGLLAAVGVVALALGGLAALIMWGIEKVNQSVVKSNLDAAARHCNNAIEALGKLEPEVSHAIQEVTRAKDALNFTHKAAGAYKNNETADFNNSMADILAHAVQEMRAIERALVPTPKFWTFGTGAAVGVGAGVVGTMLAAKCSSGGGTESTLA